MYVLYYSLILQCWHLVWILVSTDHPYLGVRCHNCVIRDEMNKIRSHLHMF
jgi:hypothetical protein